MKLGGETETQSHHKPHPSTLTPPCPRLPGSPRTACTLTPPCPSLPGSPRTACTLTPPCPRLPGSPRIACTVTPPSPSLPGSPRTACTHTHSALPQSASISRNACTHTHSALPQSASISQDCLHTWSGAAVTEAATHETPPGCLALVATGACTQMSHRNVTINQSLTSCPCSGTAA